MSRVDTTITVAHEQSVCTLCHVDVTAGVRTTAKGSRFHYLFCRRCAARIGVAARVITSSTRWSRGARKGD